MPAKKANGIIISHPFIDMLHVFHSQTNRVSPQIISNHIHIHIYIIFAYIQSTNQTTLVLRTK